ncbi:mismatch repair endonuclease PMS2-like [Apostichopus japonicus]|uniref:mismatch repair endonuclease PMS2-like n=1 Tax=Stichopus japonicus TaxID=307972 RepID=UPI003AB67F1A
MAGTVRAIDRKSVHQICSGQVVLNLATAVKELVENSLDAGATNVEIKLKEYGAESIEVIDNGSGVKEDNFQALTLKHHTSKLQDFSDLTNVDTFGFRGEALSSLCALSNLSILTYHKSANVGTRLEYDHDGKIMKQTPCPRQTGTTVTLINLFSTLPVRYKEFQRNIKKEFAKMVHILQGYCIISQGVKLTCSNQINKGGKSTVVATSGNTSLRENISSVFGSKQIQKLLEFTQVEPLEEVCQEYNLQMDKLSHLFRISGYISQPDHGQGRSSTDRQYLFINKRPCDFPKLTKLVNEVYHSYNRHQYPMCVLDISLSQDAVDVNLTPDKRKVLVQEEKLLLATVKSSLVSLFAPRASAYQMNQTVLSSLPSRSKSDTNLDLRRFSSPAEADNNTSEKACISNTLAGLKRSFSNPNAAFYSNERVTNTPGQSSERQQPKLDRFISKRIKTETSNDSNEQPSSISQFSTSNSCGDETANELQSSACSTLTFEPIESMDGSNVQTIQVNSLLSNTTSETRQDGDESTEIEQTGNVTTVTEHLTEKESSGYGSHDSHPIDSSQEQSLVNEKSDGSASPDCGVNIEFHLPTEATSCNLPGDPAVKRIKIHKTDEEEDVATTKRKEVCLPFSVAGLMSLRDRQEKDSDDEVVRGINFKAKIAPSDNASAENELRKEISKDMFGKMEILGQFNLGFIITRLADDLFIIDQHATDEKYNFETLQKNTVLQGQKLIQPMALELTAVNESILLDNINIFKKNGFDFQINEEAPSTQKVKLTSVPVSRNWTFSKEDVDELIFMLSDAPGVHCRPSRVRQMFASRACRKSVMIGTALSRADMTKLVKHMGEIEQPWNCPHGRPTMRHLFNLNLLPD